MISALSTFKPILYIDMDNVLVDFQSGINKLSEYEKKKNMRDDMMKFLTFLRKCIHIKEQLMLSIV